MASSYSGTVGLLIAELFIRWEPGVIGWPDNCRLSDCLPDIIWLWQDFLDWAGLPSSAPVYVLFDWVSWVWLALRSFAQAWWKWLLGWLIIISAGWFFRWRSFTRLWPYNCFPQFQYFSSLGCQAQFHYPSLVCWVRFQYSSCRVLFLLIVPQCTVGYF